jgi:hypothetical protein
MASDFDTTSAVLKELENQLPDGTSIAEILLKLMLSTKNKSINQSSVINAYFYLQVGLH